MADPKSRQPPVEKKEMEKKQLMENSLIDSMIQEIEQAFDLTTKLQSLVELGHYSGAMKESARTLSEEVLQTCSAVVARLSSRKTNVKKQKKRRIELASQDLALVDVPVKRDPRKYSYERKEVTTTPYNDGHQWRKYGEKKINGCIFTRSYYRCTYSEDQGCRAKKQVQQQDCGAPSFFLVTYKGEHTCNSMSTADDVQHMVRDCQTAIQVKLHGYIKDQPLLLVNNDAEYSLNTSFPVTRITAVTPPVEPFLLQFASKLDCEVEEQKYITSDMRKKIIEGTICRQSENLCTSSGKLESTDPTLLESREPLETSFTAIRGLDDDIVLDEIFSPSPLRLDMDLLGFDSDGIVICNY